MKIEEETEDLCRNRHDFPSNAKSILETREVSSTYHGNRSNLISCGSVDTIQLHRPRARRSRFDSRIRTRHDRQCAASSACKSLANELSPEPTSIYRRSTQWRPICQRLGTVQHVSRERRITAVADTWLAAARNALCSLH